MRLTRYTDYSLRVLIYLAYKNDQMVTITELAEFYKISRNHLVKVVHNLGIHGFIMTIRGKNGGMKLSRAANGIVIGDVVRKMEADFDLLECFSVETDHCVITNRCVLKSVLISARNDFLNTLDQFTVADAIIKNSKSLSEFRSTTIVSKE